MLTHKACADDKRGAAWSPIVPGDQVLLKNTKTSGKVAPNFEPEPFTVVAKEGHQVTVKSSEGTVYRRESSSVKPYISSDDAELVPRDTNIKDYSRPKRNIKYPARFKDFVLGKP